MAMGASPSDGQVGSLSTFGTVLIGGFVREFRDLAQPEFTAVGPAGLTAVPGWFMIRPYWRCSAAQRLRAVMSPRAVVAWMSKSAAPVFLSALWIRP